MKTFKGYINYGCLGAEKCPVYTAGNPQPTATVSEPVEYTVPDGWELDDTETGVVLTAPWGWTYEPNELLESNIPRITKDNAAFTGYDKDNSFFNIKLEWKKL